MLGTLGAKLKLGSFGRYKCKRVRVSRQVQDPLNSSTPPSSPLPLPPASLYPHSFSISTPIICNGSFWCIFRLVFTECTPETCPCAGQCSNQRIQNQEWAPAVEKFLTQDRGYGVRTLEPISSGWYLMLSGSGWHGTSPQISCSQ